MLPGLTIAGELHWQRRKSSAVTSHCGHETGSSLSSGVAAQAGAVGCVLLGRPFLASVLYVLALNHKHMLLYFAPAFFATLLGAALQPLRNAGAARSAAACGARVGPTEQSQSILAAAAGAALRVAGLGACVVLTTAAVWAPWLQIPDSALQVSCGSRFSCSPPPPFPARPAPVPPAQ
jgi:alpha-1,3-glucosyltransferase